MIERLRRIADGLRLVFRIDRSRSTLVFLCLLLTSVAGGAMSLSLKWLVNAAVSHQLSSALWAGAIIAVSQGVIQILSNIQGNLENMLSQEVSAFVDRDVLRMISEVPTLEHLERPDYLDRVSLVLGKGDDIAAATWALTNVVGLILRLAVAMWLLATVQPILALLPLFAIPALLATRRSQHIEEQVEEEIAPAQRLSHHLHNLFLDASPAKEIRIFGADDELSRRSDALWRETTSARFRAGWKSALWSLAGWSVFAAAFAAALAYVGVRATQGHGSAGEVVLVVQLSNQIRGQVASASMTVQNVVKAFLMMDRLSWMADYASERTGRHQTPVATPSRLNDGIHIENVTFRYPGTESDVLRDLSLDIPAGTSLAIVGENGAGKTTLVKLLCGYYEPTVGSICIDGIDLQDLDITDWRQHLSGAFQDYARVESLLRESVGVGQLPAIEDREVIALALAKGAAAELERAWPGGLDAQVGKTYQPGVEPSGGQWQKIAVSRAMMRQPMLLILDEPTAALDAATEDELFRRYTQAAASGRTTGSVTILISHRFSTVRAAERIIVLGDGRVTEDGSHAELMALGGRYAAMFNMQIEAFHGK